MDKERAIVARFTETRVVPSLTVSRSGTGYGTVRTVRVAFDDPDARIGMGNLPVIDDVGGIDCGLRCAVEYSSGSEVLLTAVPAAGSVFVKWTGPDVTCPSGRSPWNKPFCFVRIEGAERVTATFSRS
jgi:hypothetical protein